MAIIVFCSVIVWISFKFYFNKFQQGKLITNWSMQMYNQVISVFNIIVANLQQGTTVTALGIMYIRQESFANHDNVRCKFSKVIHEPGKRKKVVSAFCIKCNRPVCKGSPSARITIEPLVWVAKIFTFKNVQMFLNVNVRVYIKA